MIQSAVVASAHGIMKSEGVAALNGIHADRAVNQSVIRNASVERIRTRSVSQADFVIDLTITEAWCHGYVNERLDFSSVRQKFSAFGFLWLRPCSHGLYLQILYSDDLHGFIADYCVTGLMGKISSNV